MKSRCKCILWVFCVVALGACFYSAGADDTSSAASAEASRLKAGLEKLGIIEACQIVVADERDIVEDTAAQMMQRFLAKASIKASIVKESEATGEKQFLLGRDANLTAIRVLGDKGDIRIRDVSPEDDGFHLKQAGKQIVITGANPRGVLYGVYAFEDYIRAGVKGNLDVKKVPYFQKRGSGLSYWAVQFTAKLEAFPEEKAEYLSRLGINQMTDSGISGHLRRFVTSDIFGFQTPPDPEFQRNVKTMFATCKKYGIDAYLCLIEPGLVEMDRIDSYPKEAIGTVRMPWGGDKDGRARTLCVSSPLAQQYLREMMKKLVREYPDLDGINFYNLDNNAWLCTPQLCERCKQVCTDSPPDAYNPWETQAKLVTLLAKAAHEERPDFDFRFWGAVHYDGAPLDKLLHAAEDYNGLMSSWTGWDRTLMVPDAAKRSIGFTLSQEVCKERGVPFCMLAEFNSLEAIPKNLPFPYHAADALKKYKAWDVKNVVEIFGIAAELNPINALITKEFEWEPDQPIKNVLANLSRRQFGEPAGKQMYGAWKEMKKAFDVWNDVESSAFPLSGSQFFAKLGTAIGGLPPAILPEKILPYNLDGLSPEFLDKMELMNSHLARAAGYAQKAVETASGEERIGICYYTGPDGPPTRKEYAESNHSSIAFANVICMQRCNLIRAYPLLKGIEKARAAGDTKSASEQETRYRELVEKDIKTQKSFCDLLTGFSNMKPCYLRTSLTEEEIASHLAFTRDKIKELQAYLEQTPIVGPKS